MAHQPERTKTGEWGASLGLMIAAITMVVGLSMPAPASASSSLSIERTIDATVVHHGHHIDVPLAPFAQINSPSIQISAVRLTLVLKTRRHHQDWSDWDDDDMREIRIGWAGRPLIGFDDDHEVRDLIADFFSRLGDDDELNARWAAKFADRFDRWSLGEKTGTSNVVTFDITKYLVGKGQFLAFFQALIAKGGSFDLWVSGHPKVLDATITVDGTVLVPSTVINTVVPSVSPTESTTISFAFSADQPHSSFTCSLDGAPAAPCSSPMPYSGLADGSHAFHVYAANAAGFSDPTGAAYRWEIDTSVPDVVLGVPTPSAALSNSGSISLPFSSTDSDTVSFQCSLDGAAYAPCTSPVIYSGLAEGSHEIDITATDDAGNTSDAPARYIWRIDLTPPVATMVQVLMPDPAVATATSMPISGAVFSNATSAAFLFSANESSTFKCSLDGSAPTACASPWSVANLAEGVHGVSIVPTDVAGNVGAAIAYSWTVDLTPPRISLGNVVPAPSLTNSKSLSVAFTLSEPGTAYCSLDGAPAVACQSPYTAAITTEGPHTVLLTAADLARNAAVPVQLSWTMDFTNPQISFGAMVPSAAGYINSSSLTVNITATEPVTYSASLDGTPLMGSSSSPFVLSGLAEGPHALVVNAVDGAGNPANTITHSFIVDLTPPTVQLTGGRFSGPTNQTAAGFAFTASEAATFRCALDGAQPSQCASPFNVSNLVAGLHSIAITATDLAGNVSVPATYAWVIDLTPPKTSIVSATPSASLTNSTSISVAFSVNDPTAVSQCALDAGAFAPCVSPFAATALASGLHSVQIRSSDPAGNVEPSPATYSWTVDAVAPVVTLSSSVTSPTNATGATFTFTASKAVIYSCTLDGAAVAGCASPQAFSNLTSGAHAFSVVARDAAGNSSQPASIAWTIDTTAPVVSITGESFPGATNQTSNTFAFAASKPVTFSCSVDGAAAAACASPYTASALSNGTHVFSVSGVDSAGNASNTATYSWTVDTTTPTTAVSASQVPASGPSITFSLSSSKAGSTFQCALDAAAPAPCAATVSYSNLASGSHSFFARATDSLGNADPTGSTFAFSVQTSLTTSITSVTPAASPTNQTTATFSFTSSNASATFQCSLDKAVATPCASPMSYAGLSSTTHTFVVQAVVGTQVDTVGASYSWTVQASSPQLVSSSTTTTGSSFTVTWTTNVPTTTMLNWGLGASIANLVPDDGVLATTHSVTITGLQSLTIYSYVMEGHDQVGNAYLSSRRSVRTAP